MTNDKRTSDLSTHSRTGYASTAVQKGALIAGILFLLVGIAGFIPGLTQGDLGAAGSGSMAMLLGVFQVSVLHNIVHLLFGIVGLITARAIRASRLFLIVGGIAYAGLWLYGLFTADQSSGANFVPLNTADNWLHLLLALGMIVLGLVLPPRRDRVRRTSTATT